MGAALATAALAGLLLGPAPGVGKGQIPRPGQPPEADEGEAPSKGEGEGAAEGEAPEELGPVHCRRSAEHLAAGRLEAAEAVARACLATEPEEREERTQLFVLARALASSERHEEALEVVDVALTRRPRDAEFTLHRVRLLAWMGRLDEAEAALEAVPAGALDSAEGMALAGDVAYWRGEHEEAAARYARSLERRPDDARILTNRAVCMRSLGRDREALLLAAAALEVDPEHEAARRLLRILSLRGDLCPEAREAREAKVFDKAERVARACVRDEADWPAHWVELGRVLSGKGEHDLAVGWLERAVAAAPEDSELRVELARVAAWGGQHQRASDELEALPPEIWERMDVLRLAADVAFWAGHYPWAVERYTLVLDQEPRDAGAVRNRAIARMKSGDRPGALADWDFLCTLTPDDPRACQELSLAEDTAPRYRFILNPTWTYIDVLDDWYDVNASLSAAVTPELDLGVTFTYLHRHLAFPPRSGSDVGFGAFGIWKASELWSWNVGVKAAPKAGFTAGFQAWIEPRYQVNDELQLQLKYWYLLFGGGGAHVINPSLVWTPDPWKLTVRYYFTASPTPLGHSAWFSLGREILAPFSAFVGAGVGNRTDYIAANDLDVDFHWLLMAGVDVAVTDRHKLGLHYTFREERESARILQRHELGLVWHARF